MDLGGGAHKDGLVRSRTRKESYLQDQERREFEEEGSGQQWPRLKELKSMRSEGILWSFLTVQTEHPRRQEVALFSD